jgi:hypothetical protein
MSNNSFANLKRSSKTSLEKLTQEVSKLNKKFENGDDDKFWKPEVDKAGNGYAVIRFLPAPVGEDVPFVRTWRHSFKGPNGWYIEESLTTIGQEDPVAELNSRLWNSGSEENKEIARKQKRNLTFISNILVVSDSKHPENEGKVFLFRYGKKIFDKINDKINPPKEFEDEVPMDPFDLWTGADFKLKIRKVEGYRNYDKSEFSDPSAISDDDDALEAIWKSEHPLQPFIDPASFKSYDELKKRLDKALGITGNALPKAGDVEGAYDNDSMNPTFEHREDVTPARKEREAPAREVRRADPEPAIADDDDDGEGTDWFSKLTQEDD